jgi:triosephosphate isomerase
MKKWIIANWKMNGDLECVKKYQENFNNNDNLIVAAPFVYLGGFEKILCAAQNVHSEIKGAYTGEISALHLKNLNIKYCLVGHSERRNYFCESNNLIKTKAQACIANDIVPIICIGENLDDYESGATEAVLQKQIIECLPQQGNFWIAYEPLWAIGTGKTPTILEIEKVHNFIKSEVGESINVMYGGSVKGSNAFEILKISQVDGVLVGGASLDISEMQSIIQAAV